MEKRKARSRVILDIDDLVMLDYIINKSPEVKNPDTHRLVYIEQIKKVMNMSPNALIIHLKRLNEFNLIRVARVPPENKIKAVIPTANGERIRKEFFEAIDLKSKNKQKVELRDKNGNLKEFLIENYDNEPRTTTEILLQKLKEAQKK